MYVVLVCSHRCYNTVRVLVWEWFLKVGKRAMIQLLNNYID